MTAHDTGSVWDAGLQLERTLLAWRRIGLAILGLGLTSLRLTWPVLGPWAMLPTGLMVVGAVAVLVRSDRRYGVMHERLTRKTALPDGGLLLATVAVVLLMSVLALVVVVSPHTTG